MSEEEKKAIEYFKNNALVRIENEQIVASGNAYKVVILNLIDRLQKELDEKDKVIDLMAFEIAENTGSCPCDTYGYEFKECDDCNDTSKECFIEYFYKKVEEENE